MESIINYLTTGPKSTFDFRNEFGSYPRSKLKILYEQQYVEKHLINRRVVWSLKEQEISESVKDEIIRGFVELTDEVDSNPIDNESSQKLEELKGVLDEVTKPFAFKGLRLVGSE